MSGAAALLSLVAGIVALASPSTIYGRETTDLADVATAQDLTGLAVAVLLLLLARAASRGGLRAWLGLLGVQAFTAYNYAIYCFSVSFGPLFLVWVATWGLSLFALLGSVAALPTSAVARRSARVAVRAPGSLLVVMAVVFAALWLREIVPDLLAGRPSTSAALWQVPTNPVHVLDLGFALPAVAVSGILLLRRHRIGYASVVGELVFLALTCAPILLTPLVTQVRGHASGWAVVVPIGLVAATTLAVMVRLLRSLGRGGLLAGMPAQETPS